MRLTDKRFWIFEGFTIVYAVVLLLIVYIGWDKSYVFVYLPSMILLCGMCGFFTCLLSNRRHWFVFGLIYEAVLLCVSSVLFWMHRLFAFNSEVDSIDVNSFFLCILFIFAISIIPTFVLAFFGYKLFQKWDEEKTNKQEE